MCLLAGLALAPAGCGPSSGRVGGEISLRPMTTGAGPASVPMFGVRIVRLRHRLRPDAPVEDIWRLLGTTNVPHEKRALWEANDLRLGDGANLAADRLNQLLAETPDRTVKVSELLVRENLDFLISVGGERDTLQLLWTDASGRLLGRHFDQALAEFRVVCRTDPADPDAVRIALVPEVRYGKERLRWVRTGQGTVQRMVRAAFPISDLAVEVRLPSGRLLVIGGRSPTGGPGLSLGSAIFFQRHGPDTWCQTIILTAERALPGRVPESGKIPFLPRGPPAKGVTPKLSLR